MQLFRQAEMLWNWVGKNDATLEQAKSRRQTTAVTEKMKRGTLQRRNSHAVDRSSTRLKSSNRNQT